MIYLAPIGGFTDHSFGILTTPGSYGIPEGIRNGMRWAADNQAFTKGFDPVVFFPWLEAMAPYKSTCLFVACPDVIGDAEATLVRFGEYRAQFGDWPVALVAQDGLEFFRFPPAHQWQALFVGGTTEWKMSMGAIECIQRARELGKHIHIGRVNWLQRYRHFQSLPGSERFTCDGTRTRYERTRAIEAWREYMASPKQHNLFVPPSDSAG
jgi:hypothetical protein